MSGRTSSACAPAEAILHLHIAIRDGSGEQTHTTAACGRECPGDRETVTIRVSNATDIDTDTVTTKGGRVGALSAPGDGAVDTLVGETSLANCGR